MVTDASVCACCRCRGGSGAQGCYGCMSGGQHRRASLSHPPITPLQRCKGVGGGARAETRIAAAACALVSVERDTVSPAREKCRPHPLMDRPPVSRDSTAPTHLHRCRTSVSAQMWLTG